MEVALSQRPTAYGMEHTITAVAQSLADCQQLLAHSHLATTLHLEDGVVTLRWREVLQDSPVAAAILKRLRRTMPMTVDLLIVSLEQLNGEVRLDASLNFPPAVEMVTVVRAGRAAAPARSAGRHQCAQSAASIPPARQPVGSASPAG